MDKASKLFQSAEIEYITPFLRLWLSFNSWYKKLYKRDDKIKTDRQHIEKIKTENNFFKNEFEYLLGANNREWFSQLENLLRGLNDSKLKDEKDKLIYKHPDEHEYCILKDLFVTYSTKNKFNKRIRDSDSYNKRNENFFLSRDVEKVFQLVLELLYQVRCVLVHGDLDVENQTNLNIIKSAYHVLFEVLQKVFKD